MIRNGLDNLSDTAVRSERGAATESTSDDTLLHVVWRHVWLVLVVLGLSIGGGAAYLLTATPLFTGTARMYVEPAPPKILGDNASSPNHISENFQATQCELIRSTPVLALALAKSDIANMKCLEGVGNTLTFLKKKLTIQVGKKDDIISVSFDSPSPKESADLVNAVVDSYIAYQSRQRRSTATEMLTILTTAKQERDTELGKKTAALVEFKKANGALFLQGDKGTIVQQRLSALSDSLSQAHLTALNAKSKFDEVAILMRNNPGLLKQVEAAEKAGASVSASAAEESSVRSELFRQEQLLQDLRRHYMDGHPLCVATQARIDQLNVAYLVMLRERWNSASMIEVDLQKSFDDLQKDAIALNARAAEYARLESELKQTERMVELLDSRIKEINLNEGGGAMNITVVEAAAEEDKPSSPSKTRALGIALAAGLVLGIASALIRQACDQRIGTPEQIRSSLGVPVLGTIPQNLRGLPASAGALQAYLNPSSATTEAYRAVLTSVQFALSQSGAKTLLITSPSARDGKTNFAANLAIVAALARHKVLIVDANLRNPSLHKAFSLNNRTGLSTVLAGDQEPRLSIRATNIGGLDVMPAGPSNASPSEVLNGQNFSDLLGDLAGQYDYVIVDSPAALAVADARIVASACDATLLLLNPDRSNRRSSHQAIEGLQSVGANIVGAVVNERQQRSSRGNSVLGRNATGRRPSQRMEENVADGAESEPLSSTSTRG